MVSHCKYAHVSKSLVSIRQGQTTIITMWDIKRHQKMLNYQLTLRQHVFYFMFSTSCAHRLSTPPLCYAVKLLWPICQKVGPPLFLGGSGSIPVVLVVLDRKNIYFLLWTAAALAIVAKKSKVYPHLKCYLSLSNLSPKSSLKRKKC